MTVRRVPGTALANAHSSEIVYTPPQGEARLRELLKNWEDFLHKEDELDPLIRLAVAHYQFEAIHPFTDGNGRTGRVLNSLYLVEQGLLELPVLYLSRYIIQNRDAYYAGLFEVTRSGNWEGWITYVLRGIEETARWTLAKIAAIRDLADTTAAHVRDTTPKIYSQELVDLLFRQPYCRISHLTDANIVQRQTASTYLRKLVASGVLVERKAGREKLFIHTRLLQVLKGEENGWDRWPS